MKKFFVSLMLFVSCFGTQAQDETCPDGTVQYIVAITVDYYGSETGFYINENPDTIQYDGVNDPISVLGPIVYSIPAGTYPDLIQGQTFFEEVCLANECYSFSIYDTWGDGMGFTNGSYQLLIGDSVVLFGGGNFGAWDSQVFCVDSAIEILPVLGCTDSGACNFNPLANQEDGTCLFPGMSCEHSDPNVVFETYNEDCECSGIVLSGCTDESAFNFDPLATVDDGSCYYNPGCNVEGACNFDPLADFNDGSCDYVSCMVIGCMDIYANNYNPEANLPNPNACVYHTVSFEFVQNCKEIMLINTTPEVSEPGPGVFFIWEFGDGQQQTTSQDTLYYGYENGTYVVTLIYAQGQSLQSITQEVVVDDFEVEPALSMSGTQLVCDASATIYRWFLDGQEIAQTEINFIEVAESGTYICEVVGGAGCTARSNSYTVDFVGLFEHEDGVIPTVVPTVVVDHITIRYSSGDMMMIYNTSGQIIWTDTVYDGLQIDCSLFPSGVYIAQFGHTTTVRFIKQ